MTGRTTRELVAAVGIAGAKYHDWRGRRGQANRHNGRIPKGHWLLGWERQAIVDFAMLNRDDGYRLMAYRMLDADVVAVAPSSVYRVLKEDNLLWRHVRERATTRGHGFEQPTRTHEHWHVDIKYVNFHGTFLFLISVIDGFSRYIVHHELRERMETNDVEITIQRALEKFPGAPPPRIISDNGAQFVSKDFSEFLRVTGLGHVRTSVNYPQANGKIERFHRTISEECLRRTPLIELADARAEIDEYVRRYNEERPHSSLYWLTPSDFLNGRVEAKLNLRETRLKAAREARKHQRNQTA